MENIDALIVTLTKEAQAVKPAPHPFRLSLTWLVLAAIYLALSLALFGFRPDILAQFHRPWFAAEFAALVCVLFTTSLSAALLSFPDLHQIRRWAFAPLAAFALLLVVLGFAWLADNPPAPLPVHGFECTLSIAFFSLLPAVWTLLVMRHFASTHAPWAGSVALLFAFSVGALWLRVYEVTDSIVHLVEWHYLPMLGIGIFGLWLGTKILKW
ncbi:MAG: DUF1109 domain-containing protein [Nitrosomonadales bacterium]